MEPKLLLFFLVVGFFSSASLQRPKLIRRYFGAIEIKIGHSIKGASEDGKGVPSQRKK